MSRNLVEGGRGSSNSLISGRRMPSAYSAGQYKFDDQGEYLRTFTFGIRGNVSGIDQSDRTLLGGIEEDRLATIINY